MPFFYLGAAVLTGAMAGEASDKASAAADRRAEQAGEKSDELIAFEKEKYEEWKEMYGDIEQNLADFYTDMTPEFLISAGLQDEAQSFATSQTEIKTRLAQRGLGGSGLEADLIARQEIQSAEQRAEIRRDAPLKVAEMQQKFLDPRLGEKRAGERSISGAMERGANLQDRLAAEDVARKEADAASLWQSTGSIVGAGLKEFANQPSAQIKTVGSGNVPPITTKPLDYTPSR